VGDRNLLEGGAQAGALAFSTHYDYNVITQGRLAMAIRARIIKIGNSQGIRIPKPVLEQAGFKGEVEIDVRAGRIVLKPAGAARAGWAAAFAAMARAGDDDMLDGGDPRPTLWDEQEWEWR